MLLAPPLEDKVLKWMYAGSNDDYGGQPMTRLGASLKTLLWGLCEYELSTISETITLYARRRKCANVFPA